MKNRTAVNTYIFFVVLTVFSGVFAAVYEKFSNQVYSGAMIFAFVYPLVLGVIPFLAMSHLKKIKFPSDFSRLSYSFGVVTLMTGSIFKGVLEIYGTTNRLLPVYYYAAGVLILVGIITYLILPRKKNNDII